MHGNCCLCRSCQNSPCTVLVIYATALAIEAQSLITFSMADFGSWEHFLLNVKEQNHGLCALFCFFLFIKYVLNLWTWMQFTFNIFCFRLRWLNSYRSRPVVIPQSSVPSVPKMNLGRENITITQVQQGPPHLLLSGQLVRLWLFPAVHEAVHVTFT